MSNVLHTDLMIKVQLLISCIVQNKCGHNLAATETIKS